MLPQWCRTLCKLQNLPKEQGRWSPYPLKLISRGWSCLDISARAGDHPYWCPQRDMVGTTSGILVATRLAPWHHFAHTWVPDPVSCQCLGEQPPPACFPVIAASVSHQLPPSSHAWHFQHLLLPYSCCTLECADGLCPLSALLVPGLSPHGISQLQQPKEWFPLPTQDKNACYLSQPARFFLLWPEPALETRCRQQRGQCLCFRVALLNASHWEY